MKGCLEGVGGGRIHHKGTHWRWVGWPIIFLLLLGMGGGASASSVPPDPASGTVVERPLADVVTLYPVADTFFASGMPGDQFRDWQELWVGWEPDFEIERAYVRFDLSSIPGGAVINRALLRLSMINAVGEGSETISVSRFTCDPASSADEPATWNATQNCAGEVYYTRDLGTNLDWRFWDVTALVRAWRAGTYPNYGMILRGAEGAPTNTRVFESRERQQDRPELVIDYTSDATPPVSSVSTLATYQTSSSFNVSWSGSDVGSGLKWYDVQYKVGTGNWVDWQTQTTATSATFSGAIDGQTYCFQSRAQDNAGNWEAYPGGNGDTCTTVDSSPPSSMVSSLSAIQVHTWFRVDWTGSDAASGIDHYDIQSRIGPGGAWTDWLLGTQSTSGLFLGVGGNQYYFRSRAVDRTGNVESWPADYDAFTTAGADPSGLSALYYPEMMRNYPGGW